MVFKKVKEKLGLENCRHFFTGAAPISKTILEYFASLNIIINDIYGMSECSGPMTISYGSNYKVGSSGRSIPFTKIRISDSGEICT